MLFERGNSTDSTPEPQSTASAQNSPKRQKTFQTTRVSAEKPCFLKKRQRSNPPAILMNSTTVNFNVPRIIRELNAENLPDPCIITAEQTRPRSTGIVLGVLKQKSENRQVKTPQDQKSNRSSESCQKGKLTKSETTNGQINLLVEYFSRIVDNRKKLLYGLSIKLLVQLYVARCQDLQIRISKQQLLRFVEIFERGNDQRTERILNLSDMGLGDSSMVIVCKIISQSRDAFSRLDLSKNSFKDEGLRVLSEMLRRNTALFHLNISDNLITPEGATMLCSSLKNHQYITSIEMANRCQQKTRIKIGNKGAHALRQMLQQPQCLISHLDLTDNTLPPEALGFIFQGVNACRSLVSLNLSSNGLGQNPTGHASLLSIFYHNHSLVDLNLSNNSFQDRFIEEMATALQDCKNLPLQKLNLSCNKLSIKGAASLLQGFQDVGGATLKMISLVLDKNDFRSENQSVLGLPLLICTFNRAIMTCVKVGKLKTISLGSCQLDRSTVKAIGEGLKVNQFLEFLNLRDNMICLYDIQPMMESLIANPTVPLRHLDLSCNQLKDKSGSIFYRSLKNVPALETLNLRDNQLEHESAQHLIKLVKENRSICKMMVNYNLIANAAVIEIEEQCKANESQRIFRDVPKILMEIRCFKKVQDDFKKIDDFSAQQVLNKQEMLQQLGGVHKVEDRIDDLKQEQESQNQILKQELETNASTLNTLEEKIKSLDNLAQEKNGEQESTIQARQNMVKLQKQKTEKVQAELDRELRLRDKSQHVHDIKSQRSWYQEQLRQISDKNKKIEKVNQDYRNEIRKTKEEINFYLRQDIENRRNKVLVMMESPVKKMGYQVGIGGSPAKRKGGSPTKRKLNGDLRLKKVI